MRSALLLQRRERFQRWIVLPFALEGCRGAVSGEYMCRIGERQQALQGPSQDAGVAARQIGATYGILEEHIAREKQTVIGKVKAHAAA